MRQLWKIAAACAAGAVLSACGGDPAPVAKAPEASTEHGVFISTSDCAAIGKLTPDQCGQAIDEAVAQHQAQAPAFGSGAECEEVAGAERCEKGVDGRYRQRLQAFFVTLAAPGRAVPLYSPAKSVVGFQSPSKQIVDARDETLRVSEAALTVAYENSRLPGEAVDHSTRLGAAAANIH